ncbi:MAG: sulfotransferase domain-containing protein [Gemmatimonadetes bacterium]|nr:sulfotransferase domain-containing protein [Gemmatimonadota bacterium]
MARIRQRKIQGAVVGSTVSLMQWIENAVLRPLAMKLRGKIIRGKFLHYRLVYDGSPDDVFIVTYPKSGTTWLQMIVYQLTTDGAMEFAHIDEKSPHLEETLVPNGRKISDLPGTPRVVKSHYPYRNIPQGPGRYIYGVRNGLDVVVSYYHHARKYLPGWKDRSLDEFFDQFMVGRVPYGSWFEHVAGWLRNEDGLNLLIISYEELSADLETGVKRIADFCGITIDPADMPRILERCSFAFMREHEARFALERRAPFEVYDTTGSFIRQGKVGGWQQELDPRRVSEFQRACDQWLRGAGDDRFRVLSGRGAWEGLPVPASSPGRELEPAADDPPRVPLGSAG